MNGDDNQTKLFDRSSYSSRTLSIYQLVGAYLVDIYYNHLYVEASKLKNQGRVPSITEGYKHATFAFVSALDNKTKDAYKSKNNYKAEHYNKLLAGINQYFMLWTSYSSLTLSECIDKIVKEFIPEDYYKALDKDQKRNILRLVIINVIREFTKVVIVEYLNLIIDNHDEPANTDILKERLVDLFIVEREKMFHKFLESSGPDSEKVDKKFAEKMRSEITKLHEERNQMSKILQDQTKELDIRKEQLTKVLNKYRKLENNYKVLLAENQANKEKISELEQHVSKRSEKNNFNMIHESDEDDVNAGYMDNVLNKYTIDNSRSADVKYNNNKSTIDNFEDNSDRYDNIDENVLTRPTDSNEPKTAELNTLFTKFFPDDFQKQTAETRKSYNRQPNNTQTSNTTNNTHNSSETNKLVNQKQPVKTIPTKKPLQKSLPPRKPVTKSPQITENKQNNKPDVREVAKINTKSELDKGDMDSESDEDSQGEMPKKQTNIKLDLGTASKLSDIY